ncbi:reverse transcriptase N-terminal domain-containing protein [Moorena sp. SIO3I8]|uniref:reverse transcriptase N-terminal domain-containing protein n=1 Tax=Moorena sp. SIO3I8 TaxID=2607833 RepID=UPI00342DE655
MKKSKARGFTPQSEWNQVDWRKLERTVFKLQKRIYQASQRGDVRVVRRVQKNIDEVLVCKNASGEEGNTTEQR